MDVVADAVLRSRAGLAASQRGSSFLFLVTAQHLTSRALSCSSTPVSARHLQASWSGWPAESIVLAVKSGTVPIDKLPLQKQTLELQQVWRWLQGPTGVGKTELCKALAALLFDDEKMMVCRPSPSTANIAAAFRDHCIGTPACRCCHMPDCLQEDNA